MCECGEPAIARGMCRRCYNRDYRQRHYVPAPPRVRRPPKGPMHGPKIPGYARGPEWATPCSYAAAHVRVRRVRGPARELSCSSCDAPATDWALDPDADPRWVTVGQRAGHRAPVRWSVDVYAYRPLCRRCHFAETDDVPLQLGGQAANARARRRPVGPRGPAYGQGQRRPSLVERGVCPNGHRISGAADVYERPGLRGKDGKGYQMCRECRREGRRRSA